ncbi:hypothetical protein [Planctellipticum variicoloris]|uniref:hypothetical protein n=1 Tax=Planctellipticum variicoloris TaxID=3064265 RepID=UPI00301351CC|nr:hypothetical protein SH412_003267 [Planctomycetaceae bacterium SH412]
MTTPRAVFALQFELVAGTYLALIVWPDELPHTARVLNRNKSCLTVQAGDVLWIRGELEKIKVVQLYRVHPPEVNGRVVSSAAAWLDGE